MKKILKTTLIGVTTAIFMASCHSNASKPTTDTEAKDTIVNVSLYDLERNTSPLYKEISQNELTIIDFWASWCGPCRMEAPNIISIYYDYRYKGIGIVGISLDDDYQKWTNGIKELKLPWPQYSELRKWNDTLVKTYNISSIPYTIVVNRKGEILAFGLRGEELRRFVDSHI